MESGNAAAAATVVSVNRYYTSRSREYNTEQLHTVNRVVWYRWCGERDKRQDSIMDA